MNDSRDFVVSILKKLSAGRNKTDFAEYVNNSIFGNVYVSHVRWTDNDIFEVFVDFLNFQSNYLNDKSVDKLFAFAGENMEEIMNTDTNNPFKAEKLIKKLNTNFYNKVEAEVESNVVVEVKKAYEAFMSNRSNSITGKINVSVIINESTVFNREVIEFLKTS